MMRRVYEDATQIDVGRTRIRALVRYALVNGFLSLEPFGIHLNGDDVEVTSDPLPTGFPENPEEIDHDVVLRVVDRLLQYRFRVSFATPPLAVGNEALERRHGAARELQKQLKVLLAGATFNGGTLQPPGIAVTSFEVDVVEVR